MPIPERSQQWVEGRASLAPYTDHVIAQPYCPPSCCRTTSKRATAMLMTDQFQRPISAHWLCCFLTHPSPPGSLTAVLKTTRPCLLPVHAVHQHADWQHS